jgi:hypothetical protein
MSGLGPVTSRHSLHRLRLPHLIVRGGIHIIRANGGDPFCRRLSLSGEKVPNRVASTFILRYGPNELIEVNV